MCFVPYFRFYGRVSFPRDKLSVESGFNLIVRHVVRLFGFFRTLQNETSLINGHVVGRHFGSVGIGTSLKVLFLIRFIFVIDDFVSGGDFEIFEFFNVDVKVNWLIAFVDFFVLIIFIFTGSLDFGSGFD
jgi:hypothetical protein